MDQIQQQLGQLKIDSGITGFIHCDDFDKHYSDKKHVEVPKRTQQIDKTIQNFIKTSPFSEKVEQISQFEECKIEYLKLAYDQDYIDFVEGQFEDIGDQKVTKDVIHLGDTYLCRTSASTARKCVQACLTGVDQILQKTWRNAFCSVRPPGHHSGQKQKPTGFCIYNNVAIAAKYARLKYGIQKIAILDWDVHHCDGTEAIFYEDPDTLVISIHRYDQGVFYPRSGDPEKIGGEKAQFKNVNVGWNVDRNQSGYEEEHVCGYDEYIYAYERVVGPIIKEFNPEFIIISAGYDSAKGDPLGGIENTPLGYQYMTQKLSEICPKLLAVLEGGYNIDVTAECALATFKQLLGIPQQFPPEIKPSFCGINAATSTVDKHKEFWNILCSQPLLDYEKHHIGLACEIISGGHLQAFKIDGKRITKTTKQAELNFYKSLRDENDPFYEENQKLIKFMPQLIEINEQKSSVTLENLCFGMDNASILDLKIGYKTYNPNGSQLKKEKELKKAQQCEQNIMGFRVAGVKVRDQNGKLIVSKNGSMAYKTITNHQMMKQTIESVLKSNGVDKINQAAHNDLIKFLESLITILLGSKRMFRSTSILLIVDNKVHQHRIKWIDFNYVMNLTDDVENPNNQYDTNLVGGLRYLIGMLRSIN